MDVAIHRFVAAALDNERAPYSLEEVDCCFFLHFLNPIID